MTKPKDLGIKIGTKDEALWNNVKREAKILIEQSQNNLKIQTEVLKLAEKMIEAERVKKQNI